MQVECTNCKQVLADVDVKIPFHMQVGCGECGNTFGVRCLLEEKPELVAGSDEELSQAESSLKAAIDKLDRLKAARPPAAGKAGS
jgi:predicted  nucleic acid-binding Zn-ribbon protein